MHAFDVLGDPVRRRILELLGSGEHAAGDITANVQAVHELSQPAVSRHLAVLRESGFVRVRVDGARRVYSLEPTPFASIDRWLDQFRGFWDQRLDALETEHARTANPSGRLASG